MYIYDLYIYDNETAHNEGSIIRCIDIDSYNIRVFD
jgi:hypothetical protein